MFSPQAWAEIAGSRRLSGRELQIGRGVLDDLEELTIARALGVLLHTIHTHVERLHQKLGIADRAQLLQRVMQEFLPLTAAPENGLRRFVPTKPWGDVPSARDSAGRLRR
jgi:DNA-binding CsgD family transcriptional regulator